MTRRRDLWGGRGSSVPLGTIRAHVRATKSLRQVTVPDLARSTAEIARDEISATIPVFGPDAGQAELASYHARAAQGVRGGK